MVEVRYDRRACTLSVCGHAGAAPHGEDLVCAAASILGFTAVSCAEEHRESYLPSALAKDGEIRISCRPTTRHRAEKCREMRDVIFTGFEILEKKYPDYVRTEREDQ